MWGRLALVLAAWRELHEGARLELVADESLALNIGRADRDDDVRDLGQLAGGRVLSPPAAELCCSGARGAGAIRTGRTGPAAAALIVTASR